jgi:Cdc6-like AAA superfamily ATPase
VARPIPNTAYLFCGESGTGKTTMALSIAKALNAQVHHIPARQANKATIEKVWDAVHYTTWSNSNWHVVIIDEVDLWRADLQDMMLSLWDSMGSLTNTLFGDWTPNPPQAIWLCTTNQDHRKLKTDSRFEPRFLSRVRVVPFSSYGMEPAIAEYLDKVWHSEGGKGNALDWVRVAKESRNNLRECLNVLESELAQS